MRIIKFRGKRIDNDAWVEGDLKTSLTPKGSMLKQPAISTIKGTIGTFFVIPETVGQFTGLFDKNGKEIYEGDLLGSKGKVVGWVKGDVRGYCYDVVYVNHPAGEKYWSLYDTVKHDYPEQIEVIGNIYDNPELLK